MQNKIQIPIKTKIATATNFIVSPVVLVYLVQNIDVAGYAIKYSWFGIEKMIAVGFAGCVWGFLFAIPIFFFINTSEDHGLARG